MIIAMANDHAGTQMKEEIKAYLISQGYEVKDFGTYDDKSCDLSDFVYPAALAVARGECDRGIFCQRLDPKNMNHDIAKQFYDGDAEHDMYIGEVVDIIASVDHRNI